MKSSENFTGFSEAGIDEAVQNALENAGNPTDFEVIETIGTHNNTDNRQYKVVLKTLETADIS